MLISLIERSRGIIPFEMIKLPGSNNQNKSSRSLNTCGKSLMIFSTHSSVKMSNIGTYNIVLHIYHYQCGKNKDDYIQLHFNTANLDYGAAINKALDSRYSTVDHFNCPDN